MFGHLKCANANPVLVRGVGFEAAGKDISWIAIVIEKIHSIITTQTNEQAGASAPVQTWRVRRDFHSPGERNHSLCCPNTAVRHSDIQLGIAIAIRFLEPVRFFRLNLPASFAFEIRNVVFPKDALLEKEIRAVAANPANASIDASSFLHFQTEHGASRGRKIGIVIPGRMNIENRRGCGVSWSAFLPAFRPILEIIFFQVRRVEVSNQ